jgi:putative flavoprotein involved in K+ transport
MRERVEVAVIGAGQAGLAVSYYLRQQNREHIVLERARLGETWRSERWDSFCLVTPNWTVQLPGFPYQGDAPGGFMPRDEIVTYLERYTQSFALPLRTDAPVTSLRPAPAGSGFLLQAGDTIVEAHAVVVATGAYQRPKIPALSAELPESIFQIHTSQYRSPDALPAGAVLVVGTGQSGCQIAEELNEAGRRVYLSLGRCGRLPRRYRGRDIVWWVQAQGQFEQTLEALSPPEARFACNPHLSGKHGGLDINLWRFAHNGVVLLGRLLDVRDSMVILAPDLQQNLAFADQFATDAKREVDEHIRKTGLDAPLDDAIADDGPDDTVLPAISELDLRSSGIATVIWASGYRPDYSWIELPIFDARGYPIHRRGVTADEGLYFVGLHWQHKRKSALLLGVGEDAAYVAEAIATRTERTTG